MTSKRVDVIVGQPPRPVEGSQRMGPVSVMPGSLSLNGSQSGYSGMMFCCVPSSLSSQREYFAFVGPDRWTRSNPAS